ncbi:MAG: serine hydroxymethyltransferase, partial [Clostridia bacterium]|nr:serine hydroxymethyltransferase [Clostridia bacterium]
VVKNAAALCDGLKANGLDIVSGGTDNHLMLLKLINTGITGKELEHRLDEVHITANKNTVPNDPQSPFVTSGVRLGTPAVTTRGFKEAEMAKIANWITLAINDFDAKKAQISEEVQALCANFPIY